MKLYNKYTIDTYSDIDGVYDLLDELGFDNTVDAYSNHYYWRADTAKRFYLSIENLAGNYVEIFANIKTDNDTIDKFKIQPFALNSQGARSNYITGQGWLLASTITLYGGGIVFGIRAPEEYQVGFDGDLLSNDTVQPPAKWFAIIPPEDRNRDEWLYLIFDQAYIYDYDDNEYKTMTDRVYNSSGRNILYGYEKIPKGTSLNCTILTNVIDTVNNVKILYRNLWTYGIETNNSISYFDRIFTVGSKQYILLNDCNNVDSSDSKSTILCRYL